MISRQHQACSLRALDGGERRVETCRGMVGCGLELAEIELLTEQCSDAEHTKCPLFERVQARVDDRREPLRSVPSVSTGQLELCEGLTDEQRVAGTDFVK